MLFLLNSAGVPSVANWVHVAGKTLDVPVAVGSDDAEENVATGATSTTSTDLQMTTAGAARQRGDALREPLDPAGSVITKAYVQFEVDEVSTGAASLRVRGQAANDALTFTNTSGNISSRARTGASVAWQPRSWPTVQVHGVNQRTPDLSRIVQEIVNRPGWASGNAIAIIVTGTGRRTAESRNGTYAPILHLEFQHDLWGGDEVQRRGRSRARHGFVLFLAHAPRHRRPQFRRRCRGRSPSVVGEWTTPFDIGLVPVHSVLLPSGKLLLFEKPGAGGVGSRAAIWDPVTGFLSGPPRRPRSRTPTRLTRSTSIARLRA